MIASALEALPSLVVSMFLVFCRIGSCLMLVPGFSSARIPAQVRLMFSLGASVAVYSALGELEGVRGNTNDWPFLAKLAFVEVMKGVFIGFMARFFFAILQFLADAAASAIGLSSNSAPVEDDVSLPAFASIITVTASALFFVTDQHLEILRALVQSYNVMAFGAGVDKYAGMTTLVNVLGAASLLSLQVCSPFLVYAIIINTLFGILNKLVPQIPVIFIMPPFIIGGGLTMMYFLSGDLFTIFIARFSDWLTSG